MRSVLTLGIRRYGRPRWFTPSQPHPLTHRIRTPTPIAPRPPDPRPIEPRAIRRLVNAVLLEAIEVLRSESRITYSPGVYVEAQRWVLSDDDDDPFAFRNVCDVLGRNPEAIRRMLARYLHRLPPRDRLQLAVGDSE